MRLLSLPLLAVLLVRIAVGQTQQQQRPSGSIEGTVTRLGTSQPLPNAEIRLTRRGGPAQLPAGVQGLVPGQALPVPPAAGGPVPAGRGAALPLIVPVTTD